MATCRFLEEIAPLVDQLVETYMGRYERPNFGGGGLALQLATELTDADAVELQAA